jgi:hypothetical protein
MRHITERSFPLQPHTSTSSTSTWSQRVGCEAALRMHSGYHGEVLSTWLYVLACFSVSALRLQSDQTGLMGAFLHAALSV